MKNKKVLFEGNSHKNLEKKTFYNFTQNYLKKDFCN